MLYGPMNAVLKLNADYTPVGLVTWATAMELTMGGKATVVEVVPDRYVRSEHLTLPWPAVIALRRYRVMRSRVKYSPKNVILRDLGRCNYCGVTPRLPDGRIDRGDLTMDHVIPRAQAVHGTVYLPWAKKQVNVTSWENAATACKQCNSRKADKSPDQAGMRMLSIPRSPTQTDVLRMALSRLREIPEAWKAYLPAGPVIG